jgi:hypothetical protein
MVSDPFFRFLLKISSEFEESEPIFVNLLGSPGIDFQPGGIDSGAP